MSSRPDDRGVSPVIGSFLLVALTVCFAAVVAVAFGSIPIDSARPDAAFGMEVGADGGVELDHVAGDPVDVGELSVNGEPLDHQPDVPFHGNEGFDGAASGPFHPGSGSEWLTGETASVKVAGTNDPEIDSGDRVTVVLAGDGETIAHEQARAG